MTKAYTSSSVVSIVPMEPQFPQAPNHSTGNGSSAAEAPKRGPRPSFEADCDDLLDNDIAKVFSNACPRGNSAGMTVADIMAMRLSDTTVDWSKQKNRERLHGLQKIIKSLFWALENELTSEGDNGESVENTTTRAVAPVWLVKIVRHNYFTYGFLVLTLYALFGPDLCAAFGTTALNRDNYTLAIINTIMFCLFLLEEVLNCLVYRGYVCSLRFWIDALATFSMAGDSIIGTEFLQSDAFVAMRGSRLTKILRVGGRSSKFVRFLRVARNVQLLRFVPKLNDIMQRATSDLALNLWLKRMRNVFIFCDTDKRGLLGDVDLHFMTTAMQAVFPEPEYQHNTIMAKVPLFNRPQEPEGKLKLAGPMAFSELTQAFFRTALGKRTYQRCREDIDCMKESCALVEHTSDLLSLKVCILVLMLLLVLQLLMSSDGDSSRYQGIHQVDSIALSSGLTATDLCDFISDQFSKVVRDATMLLVIANYRVFWEPGCTCCHPEAAKLSPAASEADDIAAVEAVMKSAGLEAHEFFVAAVKDSAGKLRSVVVFDNHSFERSLAVNSLLQTLLVVVLLTALVIYFSTDMRKMAGRNVLHPLWNLMDDMCSLKNIDILAISAEKGNTQTDNLDLQQLRRILVPSSWIARRCHPAVATADELFQLRVAFDKLHVAMSSWSKYVPLILLKHLFEAKVEAKIGCVYSDVSVVFVAVKDFEHVCDNLTAAQVLELMSGVLSAIHEALDMHGGTMLEFIGDEVLAIFNAPVPIANYQKSAIAGALATQELVAKLRHKNVALISSVHQARVLAGNLGSPTRMKYGVLGDGVNMSARLKSLNTRYNTHLLVSTEGLNFPGSKETFITRPVGELILKGRNTPTPTFEVLGDYATASRRLAQAAEKHTKAFALYKARAFPEAKQLFEEVHDIMWKADGSFGQGDKVSQHMISLCEQCIENPPPESWDGSEKLVKKAF